MFGKSNKQKENDQVIMRIVKDGETRDITVKELLLSQNLSMEALTSVLIKKGVLTPQELLDEIEHIRTVRSQLPSDVPEPESDNTQE